MNVSCMLACMCVLSVVKLISLFCLFLLPFYGEIKICIIYTVSQKNVPTLTSCSFDKHGLILIFLVNNISALSKMICRSNFPCPFTFTHLICDGKDAK